MTRVSVGGSVVNKITSIVNPASQAEVDAGVVTNKFVSPKTLNDWPGGGSGVTSFSSGDLSPLFTTSVADPTTTPALSFTLSNQSANLVLASPVTGGAAAPTFRSLVAADIPALSYWPLTGSNTLTGAFDMVFNGATNTNTFDIDDTAIQLRSVTTGFNTNSALYASGSNALVSHFNSVGPVFNYMNVSDAGVDFVTNALSFTIGGSPGTNGQVLTSNGTNATWATPAVGSSVFSDLIAATGTNTIDNVGYAQEWQWNSLAGATGLKLSSNSTAATGNAQALFEANLSGANATSTQTTFAARFVNSHTGTSSTNVAGYFEASGGTNNNAIVVGSGNVLLNGAAISFGAGTTSLRFPYLDRFDNNTVRVNGVTPAVILGQSSYATTIRGGNATPDTPALSPTQSYQSGLGFTFPGGGAQGVKLFYYTGSTTTMGLLLNESGSVLIGGTTITTNALLDLQSTTKAFIPPRMTTIQRDAIGTPSAGMIIFNTTTGVFNFHNGSAWNAV